MQKAITKRTAESIYLEYVNDWLTVSKMAEYYSTSVKRLNKLIDKGRDEHIQRIIHKTQKPDTTC